MTVSLDAVEAAILIVDDQALSVRLLEQILKSGGYSFIRSTTDPREAAELFRSFQPDLVLLDLTMPYLDGFAVMEQLTGISQEVPPLILILSMDTTPQTRTRALGAGAVDVLPKPYDRQEVLVRVRQVLKRRLLGTYAAAHQASAPQSRPGKDLAAATVPPNGTADRVEATKYRDDTTGLHVVRVGEMCARLGRKAGRSEVECGLLAGAARFHDIGEIAIPDPILHKPGGLDPLEIEIMQSHTTIGASMLSGSALPLLQMAEQIALTHHEKWDGSGYPRGLQGNAIPLAGRICALCDVFDVLTEERPYRDAWPIDGAVAQIVQQRGKAFDPSLVDLFQSLVGEMIAIKQRFQLSLNGRARETGPTVLR
jgi:putative two-component system response regulator